MRIDVVFPVQDQYEQQLDFCNKLLARVQGFETRISGLEEKNSELKLTAQRVEEILRAERSRVVQMSMAGNFNLLREELDEMKKNAVEGH
jgi:cysteinyl-tRNA synthetase